MTGSQIADWFASADAAAGAKIGASRKRGSTKRRNTGLRAAENQRVDVVRAFVRVDRLEVHHVADHVEFVGDAVAAVHVARVCEF